MNRQAIILAGAVQFILAVSVCGALAEDRAKELEHLFREYPVNLPCPTQAIDLGVTPNTLPAGWSPTGIGLVLHSASVGTALFEGKIELACIYNDKNNPGGQLGIFLRKFVAPHSCILASGEKGFRCKAGS
jgi:hypothetical protein